MVNMTKHANKRSKQRQGYNKKAANRIAKLAWEQGIRYDECTGSLRRWIDMMRRKQSGTSVRIHGEYIYMFMSGEVLVTIMCVPNKYKQTLRNIKEKR